MRYGRRCWAILALAIGGSPNLVRAQTQLPQRVLLVGRVHDQERRALEGVDVIVNRHEVRATSDGNGFFTIRLSPLDSTVGFRRIGYRPMLLSLRPLPPPGDTILVELITSPVQLPELIASAPPSKPVRYAGTTKYDDVFFRRRIGFGTLITREAIDRRFGVSTAELLQGIPGVHVFNSMPKGIRFARCLEPGGLTVFIDGARQVPMAATPSEGVQPFNPSQSPPPQARLGDSPEVEMLSRVDPSDIEMIEVFRGASEIPGVFHWNGCAVVAIWTRWNR